MVGQTLAHYQITRKIGAGGMGEVYRATDSKLHRDVAIKVISAEYARDPDRMARFEREAQVLASLSHGSIAAVYGLEDANGSKALVMELVEGEDLSERLKRGPVPIAEAVRVAAQIAEALEAAHEHGIIHRDLKPANVKLVADGKVKLLDFGLAKALEDAGAATKKQSDEATISLAATRAGIILGTAAYMSPEQATGGMVDKRTDVWAFGVVVFEMLVGKRLFEGQTTSHTIAEVIRAEIDFARLPADTPPALRSLLERCLDRDPRRRLRDIREARLALERMGERGSGETMASRVMAAPVSPAPAAPSRSVALWAVGAAIAGALLAGGAVWLMRPALAPGPALRADIRIDRADIYAEIGPGFALSPNGQHIALVVGGDIERRLIIRQVNQLDSSTLISTTTAETGPYHPFFSPDGNWVAYVTPSELRKIPVAGGTPLLVCPVNRSRGATWTPDGQIVIASDGNTGLQIVPAAGGTPRELTKLDAARKEATHRWPQVMPDGKHVLFTSHVQATGGFDQATIEAVDIATGTRKVVMTGGTYGRYVPTGHLVYVNRGTIFAVPFDAAGLEVTGTPAPVVQDVTTNASEGSGQFAFSDNGLLAYLRGGLIVPQYPVVSVDRAGRVSTLLEEPGAYASPRLSPDGKRLSLTVLKDGNFDIWVYDLERHVMTRLTFAEETDSEQIWSPDGKDLIFGSNRGNRPTALFRKPSDGSGEEQEVAAAEGDLWPTTWTGDGKYVGFTARRKTFDVGAIEVGKKAEFSWPAATPFLEIDPAFSPDGRWLAYVSNESGQQQVYVRPFPSGTGRWQISDAGGGYPRWSGNSRELFYRTDTGIMVASVEGIDGSFRTSKPQLLFRGNFRGGSNGLNVSSNVFADYDVAPDGKSFVMFPMSAGAENERSGMVTVVTNWFDELRRTSAR